jgi:hypothetical protein
MKQSTAKTSLFGTSTPVFYRLKRQKNVLLLVLLTPHQKSLEHFAAPERNTLHVRKGERRTPINQGTGTELAKAEGDGQATIASRTTSLLRIDMLSICTSASLISHENESAELTQQIAREVQFLSRVHFPTPPPPAELSKLSPTTRS